jgi:MYXO-CTERM domain-containing protein
VQCGEREVCREGICFPGCNECNGIVCTDGLSCDVDTSECVDPSCPNGCPDGTYCSEGSCVDACEGAVCPSGQICVNGDCCYPDDPTCGGDPGDEPGVDAGTDPGADEGSPAPSGCGCSSNESGTGHGLALLALIVGWVSSRRRRRAA